MTTYYYRLDNATRELVRVVPPVKIAGKWTLRPTPAQAASINAYPRNDNAVPPTPPDGMIAVPDSWAVENGKWTRTWRIEPAPPAPPRRYSKLKLYAALEEAGLWLAFEAWLKIQTVNGINAYTAFALAQDLSSAHPLFASLLASCKAALGISDSQVELILAAAEE